MMQVTAWGADTARQSHSSPSILLEPRGFIGHDVSDVEGASLQDVLDAVIKLEQDRQTKRRFGHRGTIRARLSSLLTFVNRYANAVDCLVQTGSGGPMNPAALVWGLLRILLEAFSGATMYIASILDLLEDLGSHVSLYSSYEELFFHQPRFKKALVDVYIDIGVILAKARNAFNRNGRRSIIARIITNSFTTDFGPEKVTLDRHLETLKNETTLSHRLHIHEFIAENRAQPGPNTGLLLDIEERINRWLSPDDYASYMVDIDSARIPGSGAWILDHPIYRLWKKHPHGRLLWISGDPGVGKTILSSAIIKDLRIQSQNQGQAVAYFHCRSDLESSRTTIGLLATLIAQLKAPVVAGAVSTTHVDVPACLLEAYQASIKFGRRSISKADAPGNLTRSLATRFQHLFLVVDGLDEMDEPEKTSEALLELVHPSPSTLSIVFLSRNVPPIKKRLQDLPRIHISASDVQHDIRSYVQQRSGDLPVIKGEARESIVDKICLKAEGMFLWARMIIDDMALAVSISHLESILDQCPSGLYAMYEHFLQVLSTRSDEAQSLAKDIMTWVICASRPLTIDELEAALAAEQTSEDEREVDHRIRPFRSVITELCSPFIAVSASEGLVRPIHHSIREYLTTETNRLATKGPLSSYMIYLEDTHTKLALRCLDYLHGKFPRKPSAAKPGFYDYSLTSWCHHAVSGPYHTDLDIKMAQLIGSSDNRQAWLHHLFFNDSAQPFPFQKIFHQQKRLSEWSRRAQASDTHAVSLLRLSVSETNWSLDALELLLLLPFRNHREAKHAEAMGNMTAASDMVDISYFEKMMVVRALARQLTRTKGLEVALAKLEALKVSQPDSGPRTPWSMALLLNTMGVLYDQQARHELALRTHEEALRLQDYCSGHDAEDEISPEAVWTINELGRMHRHLGHYTEAEKMHRTALSVLIRTQPDDHPERVWTINTLATALRMNQRPTEALDLHLTAYEARSKSLGVLHTHTLWTAGDVAKCYRDMGALTDAHTWFRRALDGRLTQLGAQHPDTLWSMNQLGQVLADMGRLEEARRMHKEALEGQLKILGREHEHSRWSHHAIEILQVLSK